MDLLISFDDTGSMYSIRSQVRQKINQFIDEIFELDSDLRVGIIIHNDYCDPDLVQVLDFTSDKSDIKRFVKRSSSTGGGDYKEAYAYVLNTMITMSWRSVDRVAVMIGDAPPHEKGDVTNKFGVGSYRERLDWRDEVIKLKNINVGVYPIQALNRGIEEKIFYSGVARMSGTTKLDLAQFHHITQYITAILHKEKGSIKAYSESNPEFEKNISLRNMFRKLRGMSDDTEFAAKIDLLGRFQVCDVSEKQRIKDFVNDMGVHYKAGRGFYQWTKPEKIQRNKEVLFVDRETGETLADTAECRDKLGVPLGTEGRINPKNFPAITGQYEVYIQSTSYTRNLMPDTKFLYELDAH